MIWLFETGLPLGRVSGRSRGGDGWLFRKDLHIHGYDSNTLTQMNTFIAKKTIKTIDIFQDSFDMILTLTSLFVSSCIFLR